jgi:hypothetical protein
MPDEATNQAKPPYWRRALAGVLDVLTVIFFGDAIVKLMGGMTGGLMHNIPTVALVTVFALGYLFGGELLGGTLWQRILRAQ